MEDIHLKESVSHSSGQSNSESYSFSSKTNLIRIPYLWQRKLLDKYDKIYYVTPSGHILLSNSDVYKYLADPNTCKCSLDPSLTFDEVFNFDSKFDSNIQYDDEYKTNDDELSSSCEQWFQSSFGDVNEFCSILFDVNLHLFCLYECDLFEIYKIHQQQRNDDDQIVLFNDWYSSFDWSQVMMTKNGWLLTKQLCESNLKHLANEMRNSGIVSDSKHPGQYLENNDHPNRLILDDFLEASAKIAREIEQLESEIIQDDLNYFRDNIGQCPQLPQTMNNSDDDRIVKYLNNVIQSAHSFQFVADCRSIIFKYEDPIKMIIPTAILDLSMNKQLDWSVTTLDWLKENFPIQNNGDDNIGQFDHINPFTMLNRFTIDDVDDDCDNDDEVIDRSIEKDESFVKNEENPTVDDDDDNLGFKKSDDNNFNAVDDDEDICYSSLLSSPTKPSTSNKLSTIDFNGSCSSIPIEVIEDLDDDHHNSIMLSEHIDSDLLMNHRGHHDDDDDQQEQINFEIRLEDLDDNACYQMTMNIPKNLLELNQNDDQNNWNDDDDDDDNVVVVGDLQHQSNKDELLPKQQQAEEIQLDPIGQVELISDILVEKNDFIPNDEQQQQQQQSAETDEIDDCLIIKEIVEKSIIQSSQTIANTADEEEETEHCIENDDDKNINDADNEITDDDDDDDDQSFDLLNDPNDILEMGQSSSSSSSRSLDELKSREKYYQRLQRLKRQLEIQGMPGTLSTDEKVRLSPPLPPQERVFNNGDLVWGPFGDVRFWPGKLVSSIHDDDDDDDDVNKSSDDPPPDTNLDNNKLIVRWFNSNDTCTYVTPESLRTLTEGLEAHHCARKRHRSGKPVNVLLERAIQEAMMELDKSTRIDNSSD
ncbi:uncharacterized protein LOC124499125 isoform X2 [Dermatophagoides farinae]|uniref:uncharacterized protein LOC124499125 isoform X2 n=1 Tax=Dermatophagoides farinae TaxID=6954 RepID=UPI003F629C7A